MTKLILDELLKMTNDSKYVKWYIHIINKSLNSQYSDGVYCEKHHIIPKSFKRFVDYNILACRDNVVTLPGRDHFLAHLLLTKMFDCSIKNQKMNFAFFQMRIRNKFQKKRYINSRFYESLKRSKPKYKKLYKGESVVYIDYSDSIYYKEMLSKGYSSVMTDEYKIGRVGNMVGKKHTSETKKKMSISAKLVDRSFMLGQKHSTERIEKQKETKRLRKLENPNIYDEGMKIAKEKMKHKFASGELSVKGDKNPRYGVKLSDEWKERQRETMERNANNGMTHLELCEHVILPALKEAPMFIKDIQKLANCKWRPHYIRSIVRRVDPTFDILRIKRTPLIKKEIHCKKHAEKLQRKHNNGKTFEEIFDESIKQNINEFSNVDELLEKLNLSMKTLRLIITKFHPEGLNFWNMLMYNRKKSMRRSS
jgi:hypothetical protein